MHKFQCSNFKCIPRFLVCNGVDECGDGSDENNHTLCANRPKICPNIFTDFKCANHACIKRDRICNLQDDCGDGTDERGCHTEGSCDEEVDGKRGGCQHRCNNLPTGGYLCLCDRGYVVDEINPKHCVDVNECETFGHNCTHSCTNLNGTYSCSCRDGFELTDLFSGVCRTLQDPVSLMFSTGSQIRGEYLANRTFYDVIKNEARIEDVDFDPKTMTMYWADSQEQSIKRSFIPDTEVHPDARIGHAQTVIEADNGLIRTSLSFDWVTGNLYWTEVNKASRGSGRVVVSKGDGRYRRALVQSNLEYPTSIVVDPELGVMFFADAGAEPKIETAWLDGSKRRAIVTTRLSRPEALAIDFQMDHTVYWVDSKLNVIESMDKEGGRRHVVMSGEAAGIRSPVSIDIFENNMFFVNKKEGEVVQMDKFGRGVPVTVSAQLPNPRAVRVVHPLKYNQSLTDPCKERTRKNMNPCSHLCVVVPGMESRCKCPENQIFTDRERSVCDAGESMLFCVKHYRFKQPILLISRSK